eukprot:TRINITY_DN2299_c1_g6_i1.p1 TRINITY_DN2299_c1_g6~~TRINITY_DN2299_c1_g6_i1.p1  ORF type:complete len:706 (+),score=196.98 TRINITY_DN2299_c1_g6_i1:116-2233(+)
MPDPHADWMDHRPCCTARCGRATWRSWADWQTYDRSEDTAEAQREWMDGMPQYKPTDTERKLFKYAFKDSFTGSLQPIEWYGLAVLFVSLAVNGGSIFYNFVRVRFLEKEEDLWFPELLEAVTLFESIGFVVCLVVGAVNVGMQTGADRTISRIRVGVLVCQFLGVFNAFWLLRLFDIRVLREWFYRVRDLRGYGGIRGHILSIGGCLALVGCMSFALLAVFAKLSLLHFMFVPGERNFEKSAKLWNFGDWVIVVGFINNLVRRNEAEVWQLRQAEFTMVGHFHPVSGKNRDFVNELVSSFYASLFGTPATAMETLEAFSFFAYLQSDMLLRFCEMAYGTGAVSIDARWQLRQFEAGGCGRRWLETGDAAAAKRVEDAILQMMDPDIADVAEDVPTPPIHMCAKKLSCSETRSNQTGSTSYQKVIQGSALSRPSMPPRRIGALVPDGVTVRVLQVLHVPMADKCLRTCDPFVAVHARGAPAHGRTHSIQGSGWILSSGVDREFWKTPAYGQGFCFPLETAVAGSVPLWVELYDEDVSASEALADTGAYVDLSLPLPGETWRHHRLTLEHVQQKAVRNGLERPVVDIEVAVGGYSEEPRREKPSPRVPPQQQLHPQLPNSAPRQSPPGGGGQRADRRKQQRRTAPPRRRPEPRPAPAPASWLDPPATPGLPEVDREVFKPALSASQGLAAQVSCCYVDPEEPVFKG